MFKIIFQKKKKKIQYVLFENKFFAYIKKKGNEKYFLLKKNLNVNKFLLKIVLYGEKIYL